MKTTSYGTIWGVTLLFLIGIYSDGFAQNQLFTIQDGLKAQGISVRALTDDGRYAAATINGRADRLGVNHDRFGDPTYIQKNTARLVLIDTQTGEQKDILKGRVQVGGMSWSPDGKTLAFIQMENQRYSLQMYDRERGRVRELSPKTKKEIAYAGLDWMPDGLSVLINLRADGWRAKADSMYKEMTDGPITIQESSNKILAWERVRSMGDRAILAKVNIGNRSVAELTPEESINGLFIEENGSYLSYLVREQTKTDYNRTGDSEYELVKLDLNTMERDTLIAKTEERPRLDWNNGNNAYAYAEKGKVFVQKIDMEEPLEITADFDEKVEEGDTTQIKYSILRWHPADTHLLLSSDKGYYLVDSEGEEMELVYEYPEKRNEAPRRSIAHWSADGQYLYMSYAAREKWERGITRYNLKSKSMEDLMVDGNLYSGWEFAEDGGKILFEMSDGVQPNELYVADDRMQNMKKLTDLNPWVADKKLSKSELIQYMDVDGDTLYGVLYYPVDYEEGKRYPLVAVVYETFFNNGFSAFTNILAKENYFVFRPSVDLETGYPGEAWVKGVTTGINKLVERGLVDPNKLGVQGTSYGGYATNLLITQTDRFAAAINISGKVNAVSFLGDSPKISTRNYDAAEVGQDRLGESLWEAQDKYIAHSAVFFADRIETPLLMLTGEGDWNVPATNQREMYYALRRLDKEVKWVHYRYGGHGAGRAGREEDYFHHWETVLDWYQEKFFGDGE